MIRNAMMLRSVIVLQSSTTIVHNVHFKILSVLASGYQCQQAGPGLRLQANNNEKINAINTHEYTTGMMVDDDYEEKKCAQKIINKAASRAGRQGKGGYGGDARLYVRFQCVDPFNHFQNNSLSPTNKQKNNKNNVVFCFIIFSYYYYFFSLSHCNCCYFNL